MAKLYSGKKKNIETTTGRVGKALGSVVDRVSGKAKKAKEEAKRKKEEKKKKELSISTYNTRLRKLLEEGGVEETAYLKDILENRTGVSFTKKGAISTRQDLSKEQRQVLDELLPKMGKGFDTKGYITEIQNRIVGEKRSFEEKQTMAFADRAKKLAKKSFDDFFDYIYEEGAGEYIGEGLRNEGIMRASNESLSKRAQIDDIISEVARGIHSGTMSKAEVDRRWRELESLTGVERG